MFSVGRPSQAVLRYATDGKSDSRKANGVTSMKLLRTRIQPLATAAMRSIFLLAVSMVEFATPAMAAELRGVVIGSDGQSVSDATVKLSTSLMMSLTPTTLAETTTDKDGQFHVAVPDVWYETPAPWRQELALTVATEDHGNGGILVHHSTLVLSPNAG